jgi:hypothetical protein
MEKIKIFSQSNGEIGKLEKKFNYWSQKNDEKISIVDRKQSVTMGPNFGTVIVITIFYEEK